MSNWNSGKTKMHPESFKKLFELGIPKTVLMDPSKEA
jgi:hypothetical protein